MEERRLTVQEREHRAKLKRINLEGSRKMEIREAKAKYRRKIQGSKIGLYYIYIMATVIQIFSMIAMWHFMDLSPLAGLIAATVGEVFAYAAYSAKSAKENTKGGIVYETAMKAQEEAKIELTEEDEVNG